MKKGVPRNFTKFIGKLLLAKVFSCEFCEISKNTFFIEHLWATASGAIHLDAYRIKNTGKFFCTMFFLFFHLFLYFFTSHVFSSAIHGIWLLFLHIFKTTFYYFENLGIKTIKERVIGIYHKHSPESLN